ncbi:MAG: glycoside hydrolase family 32 protein [Massilibacteroides sp.]|nr:glycoside hydrolase family 32 protein [Massilibacteroides sp.]MDD3061705.1 glycoside hydrolase family 32 protein [Massilibacteroides sp.]MDD4114332.1 glycoside hydrolase family 32 protein [Massilibacteroides sp.]MDD4660250.1 glycoside hydrolase family 32 protein [Massilibacteroides sp.]
MNSIIKKVFALLFFFSATSFAQDYTSKVPQFKFSNDSKEQLKELKKNLLIKRFQESRKQLSKDKHRPFYHFISPEGKLNDPNGLCFWQGKWHLFYQAYPPEDPRQHWGHTVSTDLIHWSDLPYAIYPNPEEMVFSGSTWVEENRVIAMYHGVNVGNMVAVSEDPLLLNWTKVANKAVIPAGDDLPYSVWDPNIWKKGDKYYSLSGGRRAIGPGGKSIRANFLFESTDLKNWTYLHPFIENDYYSFIGDDGSCPYFWPIGDNGKYIFLFFSHKSGGRYLIGDYDQEKDKFNVTSGGRFNHGPSSKGGVHAPTAYPDGKGGIIALFNMNTGKEIGDGNYTELMTLPWRLTLNEKEELKISPAGDYTSLRGKQISVPTIDLPANQEIILPEISGNVMELELTLDPLKAEAIELKVLRSPNEEEYTRITFYPDGGYLNRDYSGPPIRTSAISVDNLNSSISDRVNIRIPETADVEIKEGELVHLHIFIDKSIIEVFVNNRQCVALRTYPERDDSQWFSIKAHGKNALLKSLNAWQMKNIYAH